MPLAGLVAGSDSAPLARPRRAGWAAGPPTIWHALRRLAGSSTTLINSAALTPDPNSPAAGEDVLHLVRGSRAICALTGAGISTDSGIPDFRGPRGLWTTDPMAPGRSTLTHYVSDAAARRATWRRRAMPLQPEPRPNPGHLALVNLERQGRLQAVVTQNVDSLHFLAGTSPARLVELHGSLREFVCLSCGHGGPMAEVLERVRQGEEDPDCPACGGLLKSAAISFGQKVPLEAMRRAESAVRASDLLLVVGTRLEVFPAAELPHLAIAAGIPIVIVNAEPTRYDRHARAVLRQPISEVLPRILAPAN